MQAFRRVSIAVLTTLIAFGQPAARAASYYLSAAGDDSNPGTQQAPWRSLARLQGALSSNVLAPGDQVLFNRGDTFGGALTLGAGVSGSLSAPITFGAYGSGNVPVLTGMQLLTTWQSLGNNRWRAACPACTNGIPASLAIEGVPQPLARWPNVDEGDGGYRYYSAFSGRASITDNTLQPTPNWAGGELVLRTTAWVLDRLPIASHIGGTLLTSLNASYDIQPGYGYFIQNHLAALDRDGEWVYSPADKSITLQWPVDPSGLKVEVPTISTLVQIRSSQYVTLQDLELRGAQNDLINAGACNTVVIERVTLRFAGDNAVLLSGGNCPNSRVTQSLVIDSMNNGLNMQGCDDCRIAETTVKRIGLFAGMGPGSELHPSHVGMLPAGTAGHPVIVESNTVTETGYIGIHLLGPAVARQNTVRGWNRAQTDGGGIYMYKQADLSVTNNVLLDGSGSRSGTPYSSTVTHGIYVDDGSERVVVSGNTVARISGAGILLHNTRDVTVSTNLVFDAREAGLSLNDDNLASYGLERSQIRDNTVIVSGVPMIAVHNAKTPSLFDTLGSIDNNRYCDPFGPPQFQVQLLGNGQVTKSLSQWRADQGRDLTSTVCPLQYSTHTVTGTPGPNRVTNGTFDSNLNGWFGWYADSLDATWETGRLDGGSLRIGFKGPGPVVYYSSLIGAVQAGQVYRLGLSTVGIVGASSISAYLIQPESPFMRLSQTRVMSVDSKRSEREMFFDISASLPGAQIIFETTPPGTAVGIDNVVLQVVTATQRSLAGVTQCTGGTLSVAGGTTTVQSSLCPLLLATGPQPLNYQGLWWADPPESESGWGINFAHQGDVIFVTWFTYDLNGRTWWLTMTANKTAEGIYAGTLYQTRGPAFSATPFNSAAVTASFVGTGTLYFSDNNTGNFIYTINGATQTKAITRQVFGALPTCKFGGQPDLTAPTNFQDLWWASPAGSESGWGVNFAHEGDTIFVTWFTYDIDGRPLWLAATAQKAADGTFSGTLYRTTGPAYNTVPFIPAAVGLSAVGRVTLTFANGNNATFAYTLNGVSQSKAITRQIFRTPGTTCQIG